MRIANMAPTEQEGGKPMTNIDLRQGDCLEVMKDIEDKRVDIVTELPR